MLKGELRVLVISYRVCILAADVSPVDVISHIPILCEKKGVPYMYVRSRMELGIAAQTKRPTSVVLLQMPKDKELIEKFEEVKEKVVEKNKHF
jgi:H/ACA ribonucleoprotein complex subunit 2